MEIMSLKWKLDWLKKSFLTGSEIVGWKLGPTLLKWKLDWLKNSYINVRIKRSCIKTLNVGYCRTSSKLAVFLRAISRFDMSCAQAHWVGSKPIRKVMQLKLHKPTMVIGYSLRMCARYVNSTNPGRSNLVFRSKPIAVVEMSNRLIVVAVYKLNRHVVCACAVGRVTYTAHLC